MSSRRHSSARSSRNKSGRKPPKESSFTMQERYPVKRKGIGEQTPPKLDLDQLPTRDSKHDRSIRSIKARLLK